MLIFKKEKEVRNLILHHCSTTQDCLVEARSMMEAYVADDMETAASHAAQVKSLEHEADRLKREARNVLHNGAFLPQIRADIHSLMEMVDGIAGVGDETAKFVMTQSPQIPEEFESAFLDTFSMCLTCFHELRKALKAFIKPEGEEDSVREHSSEVSKLETEVDASQATLMQQIFNSDLELAAKMHLCQLLRLIASISDLAEDAADELETVLMKTVV